MPSCAYSLQRITFASGFILCLFAITWAEDAPTSSPSEALQRYAAKIEEIDRVAARRKAEAKQKLERALHQTELLKAESNLRYRGMLGSYFNREGRLPLVLLSVPTGENVMGEYARSVFNGRYDHSLPLYKFAARGHVVIPKTGHYILETGRGYGDFKLNGLGYNLGEPAPSNRVACKAELLAGAYEVEFSTFNNGGQLPEASIRILAADTKEELPIFVYEPELKNFLSDATEGVEFMETSKWTRDENRLK